MRWCDIVENYLQYWLGYTIARGRYFISSLHMRHNVTRAFQVQTHPFYEKKFCYQSLHIIYPWTDRKFLKAS